MTRSDEVRRRISRAMKASYARRRASKRAKQAWVTRRSKSKAVSFDLQDAVDSSVAQIEAKRNPVPTNPNGTNAVTANVKYVPDDVITAAVELLRKLVPQDDLIESLRAMVEQNVNEALEI